MDTALRIRKKTLKDVLGAADGILYTDHVERDGKEFFAAVSGRGIEGMVGKRADFDLSAGTAKPGLGEGQGVADAVVRHRGLDQRPRPPRQPARRADPRGVRRRPAGALRPGRHRVRRRDAASRCAPGSTAWSPPTPLCARCHGPASRPPGCGPSWCARFGMRAGPGRASSATRRSSGCATTSRPATAAARSRCRPNSVLSIADAKEAAAAPVSARAGARGRRRGGRRAARTAARAARLGRLRGGWTPAAAHQPRQADVAGGRVDQARPHRALHPGGAGAAPLPARPATVDAGLSRRYRRQIVLAQGQALTRPTVDPVVDVPRREDQGVRRRQRAGHARLGGQRGVHRPASMALAHRQSAATRLGGVRPRPRRGCHASRAS